MGLAIVTLATGLIAFLTYAATACRTITWWEGTSYSLAACSLGVPPPPGSLLLTLMGWAASRVPLVHPAAFRLNLANGLIAAVAVGLVTRISLRLSTPAGRQPAGPELLAGSVAGLAFAFSLSVWGQAVRFTPYMLSATLALLILIAALDWWRRAGECEAAGRIFVIFLLVGLDFSVHRTNSLLFLAILFWLTLRRPRGWLRPARWGALAGGLGLGLALQLLLIPMSRRQPWLDMCEPADFGRLWDYVSMKMMGGGFLIRLFPRQADFLHVQLADYLSFLKSNLEPPGGWGVVSWGFAALILLGWLARFGCTRRNQAGHQGDQERQAAQREVRRRLEMAIDHSIHVATSCLH